MIYETIDLYDAFRMEREGRSGGYLRLLIAGPMREMPPRVRPALLVCPGGGYGFVSEREGEPVALRFVEHGYAAAVLAYTTNVPYPYPLLEACMAMLWLRENAARLHIGEKIAVAGFSAGGHLAGMLATLQKEELKNFLGERAAFARPDLAVLSYPVVTMGACTHTGTRNVITGGDPAMTDFLSVEKRVNGESAPAFLWHTMEDGDVPVENSLLLAQAYRRVGVPFALHIFERGRHGLSLADEETNVPGAGDEKYFRIRKWVGLCLDWLNLHGMGAEQ